MAWTTTLPVAFLTVGLAVEQATMGGGLERLAESAPLIAALLGGLWIIFQAYRGLVDRVITALDANTRAFSENAAATRMMGDGFKAMNQRVEGISDRLDRLERERAAP